MIAIVPYDASWPEKYAIEAKTIREALGVYALQIEQLVQHQSQVWPQRT